MSTRHRYRVAAAFVVAAALTACDDAPARVPTTFVSMADEDAKRVWRYAADWDAEGATPEAEVLLVVEIDHMALQAFWKIVVDDRGRVAFLEARAESRADTNVVLSAEQLRALSTCVEELRERASRPMTATKWSDVVGLKETASLVVQMEDGACKGWIWDHGTVLPDVLLRIDRILGEALASPTGALLDVEIR